MPAQGFIFGKLKAQLKDKVGIALDDIESVIITHGHPDHIGALGCFLKENPSIEVVAHPEWPKVAANIFPNDTANKEYYDTLTRYYHLIMENAYLENIRTVPFSFEQRQDYKIGGIVFRKMMDIPIFDSSLIILASPTCGPPARHSIDSFSIYEPQNRILFSGDVCIERAFLRTKQSKASKCILHLNHKPHTDSLELVNEFAKTLIANPAISLILPGHGDVLSLTGESIGSSGLEEREYFEKRWEDNRLLVIDKQLCPYKMKYLEIVKGSDLSFEGRKAILGEFKVLIDQGLIWKSFILNTIDELGNWSELWNYCYFVLDGNSLAGYLKAHDNYLIEVFVIPGRFENLLWEIGAYMFVQRLKDYSSSRKVILYQTASSKIKRAFLRLIKGDAQDKPAYPQGKKEDIPLSREKIKVFLETQRKRVERYLRRYQLPGMPSQTAQAAQPQGNGSISIVASPLGEANSCQY